MKENYFDGEVLELWFEDGILIGNYKVENVDLQVGEKATKERIAFTNHKSYPILTDYSRVKSTTKEARDYFATEQASNYITAMAILTDSSVGKIIVNFYLSISKPNFPTRIFTKKEEAIAWLSKYK
jgi:hypothetical protein